MINALELFNMFMEAIFKMINSNRTGSAICLYEIGFQFLYVLYAFE